MARQGLPHPDEVVDPQNLLISRDPRDYARAKAGLRAACDLVGVSSSYMPLTCAAALPAGATDPRGSALGVVFLALLVAAPTTDGMTRGRRLKRWPSFFAIHEPQGETPQGC